MFGKDKKPGFVAAAPQIPGGIGMMLKSMGIDPAQILGAAETLHTGLNDLNARLERLELASARIEMKLDRIIAVEFPASVAPAADETRN